MLEEKDLQYLQEMEARILSAMDSKIGASGSQMAKNMQIIIENVVTPQFNLLAEKMDLLEQKMVPAEALEDAEDRLDVLEAAVRRQSREIEKLKKAQ